MTGTDAELARRLAEQGDQPDPIPGVVPPDPPVYDRHGVTVLAGDCLDRLAELADASVDAVVCDPPYGLADHRPAALVTALTAWVNGDRSRVPDGRGFMGRTWDAFVPPPAVWDQCLRVLRPGGHLVAFAGSRTQDLMQLSIRLAGFEIRDDLAWLYGSGFPKSLDVAKAIDQQREVSHPTVKPVDLMRWLVRLVCPPGGLVLDPFAGSGTTLQAARAEGMRAVGIEREPSYLPLIRARLDARVRTDATAAAAAPVVDDGPMDLFDLLDDEAS